MECKVYEFAHISKKEKRKLRKAYYRKQWFDISISYLFILMSSGKAFLSLKNGALWVLVWYTCSLLLSCYAYVNQIEYNVGRKRAKHYSKKHPNCTLQKSVRFSPEIGVWNLLAIQFLCVLPLTIGLEAKQENATVFLRCFIILIFWQIIWLMTLLRQRLT